MPRARIVASVDRISPINGVLRIVTDATVNIYQRGTETPPAVYTTAVGSTQVTPPFTTDADGRIVHADSDELWVEPQSLDIEATKDGDTWEIPYEAYVAVEQDSFNVQDYGAIGDGSTDDTEAIHDALTAARTAGGGVVYFPPGTYIVEPFLNPYGVTDYYAALWVTGGTHLAGAGRGATTIKLADGVDAHTANTVIANARPDAAVPDEDISFRDFEIDGNAGNQTELIQGLFIQRARNVHHMRVRVKNIYGTDSTPPGETFHFAAAASTDLFYEGCEVTADEALTASGFSDNSCVNVNYVNCLAMGMGIAHGFTSNHSRGVLYANCDSRLNVGGFNQEVGENIQYVNCTAGARGIGDAGAYPYATADYDLGNTNNGFVINQATEVDLVNCYARNNGDSGIFCHDDSTGRVIGGFYEYNDIGINFNSTTVSKAWTVSAETRCLNNSDGNFSFNGGSGYETAIHVITAPSVPATTVTATNNFSFYVDIYITGGTYTGVSINGTAVGPTSHARVRPGGTIAITYSSVPTWKWFRA